MIHIFWYFLSGMLTVGYIFPVLDKMLEIILTYLEMVKGKITVKITELKCQIEKLQDEEGETPKNIIGFVAPEEKDDENEDI